MSATARRTRAARAPLGPAEALEILASAVGYCQAAGLVVRAGNDPALGLVLAIAGVHLEREGAAMRFCAPIGGLRPGTPALVSTPEEPADPEGDLGMSADISDSAPEGQGDRA